MAKVTCKTKAGRPCKTGQRLGRPCPQHRKKKGRPLKINQARIEKIARQIRQGHPPEAATAMAGIRRSTYYDWLRRGAAVLDEYADDVDAIPARHPERIFAVFSDMIEKALAEWEGDTIDLIASAARGGKDTGPQWTAAAWLLERRKPDRYARRTIVHEDPEDPRDQDLTLTRMREIMREEAIEADAD